MRVFNRVVTVLLSLAVIVAAVLLLAMPDATLGAVTRTVQGSGTTSSAGAPRG